jgi:ribosomal protein S20
MGALSGSTRHNFEISTKTFARHLVQQIEAGRYDEQQATERLAEALMRAAKRGAAHPQWFEDDLQAASLESR